MTNGLMMRSDGNIVLVDNINLLPDNLTQQLLDSVIEGQARVESNGISDSYQFKTLLIATMDPAEGGLNPHVLDRFDICIDLDNIENAEQRRSIVLNGIRYETNPLGFYRECLPAIEEWREKIECSKKIEVAVPDDIPPLVSDICNKMNVEGHRGDISTIRVASALSALDGRNCIGPDDLKKAVRMCLLHRRRDDPDDEPTPPSPQQEDPSEEPDENDQSESNQDENRNNRQELPDTSEDQDDENQNGSDSAASEKVFSIGEAFEVCDYIPPLSKTNILEKTGRRDQSISKDCSGRTIGHMIPKGKVHDIAIVASIRAAAPFQIQRNHEDLAVVISKEDLREKVRVKSKSTKILFIVDGSGSVGAHNRMVAVKGAILSMLNDAYKQRDEVGLVVFRGEKAEEILPITRSVYSAYKHLETLPTGGRTPLASGLELGYSILQQYDREGSEPVMVILTDGRGNVSSGNGSPQESLISVAEVLSETRIRKIVIDTEMGLVRFSRALNLSALIGADYMVLEELNSENLASAVHSAIRSNR